MSHVTHKLTVHTDIRVLLLCYEYIIMNSLKQLKTIHFKHNKLDPEKKIQVHYILTFINWIVHYV